MKAYKHKGMKAPRPGAGPKMDQSAPPSHGPKKPMKGQQDFKSPKANEQSEAPKSAGSPPSAEAPAGASACNGGASMALPKSGCPGESEV